MITAIDILPVNDDTNLARSKMMKATTMLDSNKRLRIQISIMEAGNNVHRRVHDAIFTDIRSKFAVNKLFDNFNGEN